MRPLRIFGPCLLALPISAQMHHVDRPQRVTRAIGVYEWTGDLAHPDAARLIPVSIFTNSHFEDAGVFLAQPVPLALETGTVYALQRSGDTIGTLDLDYARDLVDKRTSDPDDTLGAWYGYGRYLPLSAAPKSNLVQHSATPAAIDGSDDDSQPHFVPSRHADTGDTTTVAKSGSPAPPDDPDRPHMTRRDASSTDNAPSSPDTTSIDDDPDRPTLGHRNAPDSKKQKKSKESGSGVEAMPTSLNADPDRPELHRGKVQSATAPAQLTGLPPNLHQVVAVSDAAIPPPHPFARDWDSPTERTQVLAAMQKLADPLARQYLTANHLTPAPATSSTQNSPTQPSKLNKTSSSSTQNSSTQNSKLNKTSASAASNSKSSTATHSTTHTTTHSAAHSTTRHTARPAAPAPLAFTDEQIAGFQLSYGGLPTFVYTAAVPTAASNGLDSPPVRVTVIAQRLPSGELQVSLSSITDESHLDRTPWMRLIDAVDPDDSHRASLLFELRAHTGRQFALYSLASAQAQQTFITGLIQ